MNERSKATAEPDSEVTSAPLARVLDESSGALLQAAEEGLVPTCLRVSVPVFESVMAARGWERRRHQEATLLGVRLVADTELTGDRIAVD